VTLTRAQRKAVVQLYQVLEPAMSYRQFRRRFHVDAIMGCVIGTYGFLTYGIELDGYTHT
jgi:hypothetical protein